MADERKTPSNPKSKMTVKMCKKIAELTQVVHMLFVRNHEMEAEIEGLKTAYEREIEIVIQDGKEQIYKSQSENKNLHGCIETKDREIKLISDRHSKAYRELESKLKAKVKELSDVNDNMNGALTMQGTSADEIERLKKANMALVDDLRTNKKELEICQFERAKLEANAKNTERRLGDADHNYEELKEQFVSMKTDYKKENNKLRDLVADLHRAKEILKTQNRELEDKNDVVRNEISQLQKTETRRRSTEDKVIIPWDVNEEINHLKREIQRYRLEISNREENFNKVFSERNPVFVDGKHPLLPKRQARPTKSSTVTPRKSEDALPSLGSVDRRNAGASPAHRQIVAVNLKNMLKRHSKSTKSDT